MPALFFALTSAVKDNKLRPAAVSEVDTLLEALTEEDAFCNNLESNSKKKKIHLKKFGKVR